MIFSICGCVGSLFNLFTLWLWIFGRNDQKLKDFDPCFIILVGVTFRTVGFVKCAYKYAHIRRYYQSSPVVIETEKNLFLPFKIIVETIYLIETRCHRKAHWFITWQKWHEYESTNCKIYEKWIARWISDSIAFVNYIATGKAKFEE